MHMSCIRLYVMYDQDSSLWTVVKPAMADRPIETDECLEIQVNHAQYKSKWWHQYTNNLPCKSLINVPMPKNTWSLGVQM